MPLFLLSTSPCLPLAFGVSIALSEHFEYQLRQKNASLLIGQQGSFQRNVGIVHYKESGVPSATAASNAEAGFIITV